MLRRFLKAVPLLFIAQAALAPPTVASEEMPDPGRTRLDDRVVEIEIDLAGGRPMAQIRVDGSGPYDFVVDTGASFSVIDDAIADELELEVVGRQTIRSPGVSEEIEGRQVRPGRLEVGGLSIEAPVLATMDLVGFSGGMIQGVLGRPHFRDLLMKFDYPASRLELRRGALDLADPATLKFDTSEGSIRFPVDAAGQAVTMVLDTGSPGGFSLPKRSESDLSFKSALQPGPTIRLVGGAHPTWSGQLDGSIRLANIDYEDPQVLLSTIGEDFGNIGFGVLRDLVVTLDQANQLVRFKRRAATDSPPRPTRRAGGPGGGEGRLGVAFVMSPGGFQKQDGGLVVRHVESGSAAELGGLRPADVVLSIGGKPLAGIEGVADVAALLRAARPLELEVLRGGETMAIVID